jgi:hypothetical protein
MAEAIRPTNPREAAACRGLLFVQLYGVYENSITTGVQAVLSFIRRDALAPINIHHNALTLALKSSFDSLSSVGPWKTWKKRLDLVSDIESHAPLHSLVDTAFPSDGSQFRASQLQTIWDIFGLTCPILPEKKNIGRVDELVENRNAIAHGRRTADDVGGGFSSDDMEQRINDIERISIYLLTEMENHYINGGIRR